jgi:hypothetical protein
MPESAHQEPPRPPRKRRSKKREVQIDKLPLNDMQNQLLAHLSGWADPDLAVIHPQRGMYGEIQPIAIGIASVGQMLIRLDHVPPFAGVPFRVALRAAFPDFPFALYLHGRQWAIQPVPQESVSA